MPERLQKILAQAGYGSRRACEDFITVGHVRGNGQIDNTQPLHSGCIPKKGQKAG